MNSNLNFKLYTYTMYSKLLILKKSQQCQCKLGRLVTFSIPLFCYKQKILVETGELKIQRLSY